MMSEAELARLNGRLWEGMRPKARRGARRHHPPRGDVRGPGGEDQLAPAEQAHRGIRVIGATVEAHGRLHGGRRSLVAHDIRGPIRPHGGPHRGQRVWRRPTRMPCQHRRHHARAAGADRWGHRPIAPRTQQPGRRRTGRTLNGPEACDGLRPQRFPASISWERIAAIQQRVVDNRATADA